MFGATQAAQSRIDSDNTIKFCKITPNYRPLLSEIHNIEMIKYEIEKIYEKTFQLMKKSFGTYINNEVKSDENYCSLEENDGMYIINFKFYGMSIDITPGCGIRVYEDILNQKEKWNAYIITPNAQNVIKFMDKVRDFWYIIYYGKMDESSTCTGYTKAPTLKSVKMFIKILNKNLKELESL
jgi:hypothetical protein